MFICTSKEKHSDINTNKLKSTKYCMPMESCSFCYRKILWKFNKNYWTFSNSICYTHLLTARKLLIMIGHFYLHENVAETTLNRFEYYDDICCGKLLANYAITPCKAAGSASWNIKTKYLQYQYDTVRTFKCWLCDKQRKYRICCKSFIRG